MHCRHRWAAKHTWEILGCAGGGWAHPGQLAPRCGWGCKAGVHRGAATTQRRARLHGSAAEMSAQADSLP